MVCFFLELAFYFGCPGVNAFGGFVTFVYFVEGKSYECTVYHGDGRGEGIPVRADFVAQEGTPAILQVLVEYSDAVAECVAVEIRSRRNRIRLRTSWKSRRSSVPLRRHTSRPAVRRLPKWRYLEPALRTPYFIGGHLVNTMYVGGGNSQLFGYLVSQLFAGSGTGTIKNTSLFHSK